MKKHLLKFKSWLLLLCMIVGATSSALADEYKLVKDVAELAVDDIILITNGTDGAVKALGAQNSNNRAAAPVSISSETITLLGSAVELTLDAKNGSGYFTLKSGSNYLYAANTSSGKSNYLKEKDSKVYWSIEINTTNYKATIKDKTSSCNSRDWLRYNSSSELFSCYGSGQNDVYIFKKQVAPAATLESIALSGTYPTTFYQGDAFSHEGMTVTATYDDESEKDVTANAIFSGYDMSTTGDHTVTVSYTENEVTKTAEYGITVNPLPKYTVTFADDSSSETQDSYGASVTLPSRSAISGYTFAGWSETNVAEETTTAPTIIPAGSYTPTTNITLYPVYTKTEGGGGSQNETASVTISAYATANNWSNGNACQPLNMDANISVGGEVSGNNFKYYTSDSSWRFYTGGSFTITANNGATLSSVTLTISSGTLKYGETTLKSGTAFNVTGNSAIISCTANARITAISVDYTIAGAGTTYYWSAPVAAAVERPEITVAENPFLFSTTATITCETEGAAIKYSYDNENWNDYSSALTITETKTIYAKAVKDAKESTVASVTATKNLATPTVTISGAGITNTNVYTGTAAGSLAATVTYNEAAVEGAVVIWSGNNDKVATIDAETGAVTLVAAGSVTFTATYAGNSDYAEKTATYEMTIINVDPNAPGTENNPYTVAQAIAATPASGTSANVYIRGIVSAFYGSDITDDYSHRYYISDDGTTTGQLLVYNGKGLNNVAFSAAKDLQLGDVVVILGGLTTYNSTKEVAKDNYIVSLVRKVESDLALTSDDEVELEITSANINPTSTIEWSTSSEGAMTFTSSNESVATVTNAGVITAVGEGEATITFSQAADEAYKASTNKTVTVTVNDNRSAVATGIDLTSAKTINLDEEGVLTATSTKTDGFTGEITYSYVSGDEDILLIDDADYVACGVGATTITITATPTGGNAANYKSASQVVNVQVNGTNSINLDLASKTQVYSAGAFNIAATVPTANYDGVVTAESNNENVATVSVNGTTVTVTPKAVGSATITVTAGTGTYYTATASETCAVTISAPEGKETAPSADVTETFDFSKNGWSLPTSSSSLSGEYTKDEQTVTISGTGYYYGSKALLLGKSGAYITLPAFSKPVTQIDVVGVEGASGSVKQNIYVDSEAVSTETIGANGITNEYEIDSEYQDAGTIYTLKVTSAHNTQIGSIVVHMNQDPSETVTINKYGYATYCSVNPMDFSETEGYTAWYVSHITSDGVITFNKITGTIKGGQGVLLYNIDADEVNTSNVNVKFASSENELVGNLLVGTTAPTYVEETSVYGLSGDSFKKNSAAGTIGANKAYLDANDIPNEVQAFTFVFEDDETGITETRTVTREEVESIFNLAGQRLNRTQKGINIVNGKKVFIKK